MGILQMLPSVRPSVTLSPKQRTEFNQICYMNSPHGKGVREQHYFSVRPSVPPSVRHAISNIRYERWDVVIVCHRLRYFFVRTLSLAIRVNRLPTDVKYELTEE